MSETNLKTCTSAMTKLGRLCDRVIVANDFLEPRHCYAALVCLCHCAKNIALEVVVVDPFHEVGLDVLLAHLLSHDR